MSYTPHLDGLRALAVIAVLIFHALPTVFEGGFLGVDVFFVLSGYLITRILLDEHQQTGKINILRFYIKRLLRLWPALAFLIAVQLLYRYTFSNSGFYQHVEHAVAALLYVGNWLRAFQLSTLGDLGHTWSLAVEYQFYFFWPFYLNWLFWLSRRPLAWIVGIAITILLSIIWRLFLVGDETKIERLYNGTDLRIETLLWGSVLAVVLAQNHWLISIKNFLRQINFSLIPVVVALLIFSFWALKWDGFAYYWWGQTSFAVVVALLIMLLSVEPDNLMVRVLSNPLLLQLGVISYGVYLWHFPVYIFLAERGVESYALLIFGCVLTVAIALISWRLVEMPALRIKAKLQ